jgi:hypothetical protein
VEETGYSTDAEKAGSPFNWKISGFDQGEDIRWSMSVLRTQRLIPPGPLDLPEEG